MVACTRLVKRRRMRSSSSEATDLNCSSISARMAVSRAERSAPVAKVRVEAGLEQSDNADGDRGVLAQSLPHIILAERRANLAQVAGEGSDGRNFAPAQGCPQNERVVPVGFGAIAHHRHDRGF